MIIDIPKYVSYMWHTRQLFYRPDPLGYCIIMQKLIWTQEYNKLSVEERQKRKGYM